MFWYKGWLETRFQVLFALGFYMVVLVGLAIVRLPPSSPFAAMKAPEQVRTIVGLGFGTYVVAMSSVSLAGAGIATQSFFHQTKGLHGSTLFTLSLPVSRFRLLLIRASLGWFETVGLICALCLGIWVGFPRVRTSFAPEEMLKFVATLVVCSLGLYSIPMLLATFLDDVWRMFGSPVVYVALWWLFNLTSEPAPVNIFRAMADNSPLVADTTPWAAMALSVAMAAALFPAVVKIVQMREH